MKKLLLFNLISLVLTSPSFGQMISTIAGGGLGDNSPATNARSSAVDVAIDQIGRIYMADFYYNRIRRIDTTGIITTIAGANGLVGFNGDNIPAMGAALAGPSSLIITQAGDIVFTDKGNYRIRKIDNAGIVTTIAGTGVAGYSGDNGPAVNATMGWARGLAIDYVGNIYFTDENNNCIRKINTSGIVTTIAGTGVSGFNGDNIPAITAQLKAPASIVTDALGNLFFTDEGNHRVRKIDANGIITTIAGSSAIYPDQWYNGSPALAAHFYTPHGIDMDAAGNVYISDVDYRYIHKISPAGTIQTLAGDGSSYWNPIGIFSEPQGLFVKSPTEIFIADGISLLKLDTVVTLVAGKGIGDSILATNSFLTGTCSASDSKGNIYIAERTSGRIRKIDAATGIITTILSSVNEPNYIIVDKQDNVYFSSSHRVKKIDTNGIVSLVAGASDLGCSGCNPMNGSPATLVNLDHPAGIAFDDSGNVYFAESGNHRIRKVNNNGIISTIAGQYQQYPLAGYNGDSIIATTAKLYYPRNVIISMGHMFIADAGNHRLRKVDLATSIITTVAGTGTAPYNGDSLLAAATQLDVIDLAIDTFGSIFIADQANHRIRKMDTSGIVTTVAGNGTQGFSGDLGPATLAQLKSPAYVRMDINNNLVIGDELNYRIRLVCLNIAAATVSISPLGSPVATGQNSSFIASVANAGYNPNYQWILNGVPVPGANSSIFTSNALQHGDILQCKIIIPDEICPVSDSAVSNSLSVIINNLPTVAERDVRLIIYPNPGNGVFTVKGEVPGNKSEDLQVQVVNILGQTLHRQPVHSKNGEINLLLFLSLPAGVYTLQLNGTSYNGKSTFMVKP